MNPNSVADALEQQAVFLEQNDADTVERCIGVVNHPTAKSLLEATATGLRWRAAALRKLAQQIRGAG